MDDLISRQAAVELAMKYCPDDDGAVQCDGDIRELLDELENLPPAQPESKWIPCSERLPEIGEYVLCYLKGRRYFGQYRVCKYCAADKYVNHPYFDFNENGFPNVVAWMPLPEPYKEGGGEQE